MDNDTAILLLLADLQRQVEGLKQENQALRAALDAAQRDRPTD